LEKMLLWTTDSTTRVNYFHSEEEKGFPVSEVKEGLWRVGVKVKKTIGGGGGG